MSRKWVANPKVVRLRMLDLVVLATLITLVASSAHEALEAGEVRIDRVLVSTVRAAFLWLILYVADLVLFPTTIMTRFVLREVAPVAAVTATLWTVFTLLIQGLELQLLLLWIGTLLVHAPIVALAMVVPERRRQRQRLSRRELDETDPANAGYNSARAAARPLL